METTTASIFCCQLGRNFLHRRLRCKSRAFVLSPRSLGSKTSFPVETLQTNLFTTLIMSISSFLKTARFVCLISHLITPYSISCIDRRQLTELSSIDPSRRCLDTPAPRRGGAAEQPGVHSEWDAAFFLSKVMIVVKSHFTSHCRVCKCASAEAHPRTSALCWAQPVRLRDPSTKDGERVSRMKSRGGRRSGTNVDTVYFFCC